MNEGGNGVVRCGWALRSAEETRYHDTEWGVPTRDDARQFEFLILESAQSGLSWLTVLRKREGYRRAFAGFDPEAVARYAEADVERLLADAGIIRNRRKIEAAIANARAFLAVREAYGSFSDYIWGFVDGRVVHNAFRDLSEIPAETPLSRALAKDMKARGFRHLGPVTLYSHLQAVGLVNDHLVGCFRYEEVAK